MELSTREQELYDFIKNNDSVTIKQIQEQLSPQHVGAISKLKRLDKVKKEKRKTGEGYNVKITSVYVINKKGKNNDTAT